MSRDGRHLDWSYLTEVIAGLYKQSLHLARRIMERVLSPQLLVWSTGWLFNRSRSALIMRHAEHILVVRPDGIGDVIWTSPFLRQLRSLYPLAHISLLVSKDAYSIVELCPYVDEVIVLRENLNSRFPPVRIWRALSFAARHLWNCHFDMAIMPRPIEHNSGLLLAYFSRAAIRVGHAQRTREWVRDGWFDGGCLLTHVCGRPGLYHEVERALEICSYLGGEATDSRTEVWISDIDRARAATLLSAELLPSTALVVAIGLGARTPQRTWPIASVESLCQWLIRRFNAHIILVGGPESKSGAVELARSLPGRCANTAGLVSLREAAACLEHADLFIGNDTGTVHLAAAIGLPIVCISAHPRSGLMNHPSSPLRVHPWGVPYLVVQPEPAAPACQDFCMADTAHCIANVSVDAVQAAVTNVIQKHVTKSVGPIREARRSF